jgi:hypothetical protein
MPAHPPRRPSNRGDVDVRSVEPAPPIPADPSLPTGETRWVYAHGAWERAERPAGQDEACLLYTSDAADDM